MTRETATERRAREALEARAAMEQWERDRPMALLHLLARVSETRKRGADLQAEVFFDDGEMKISIIGEGRFGWIEPVNEVEEWEVNNMLQALFVEGERQDQIKRRERIRLEVLAKLTDEEKEAVGL